MMQVVLLGTLLTATALGVSGCSLKGDASCLVFQAPSREVKGADRYSQQWADETVERGVSACAWRRPWIAP